MTSISITPVQGRKLAAEHSVENQQLAADTIKTWKRDPKIRVEFNNNLTSYAAYRKAEAAGRLRICGKG
ncbi:MAG: hypothetical protein Q7U07_01600 [Gammaproteobacteria bacterium]|nr:hypothetical protein [Gammaproteobacteria bacterium]